MKLAEALETTQKANEEGDRQDNKLDFDGDEQLPNIFSCSSDFPTAQCFPDIGPLLFLDRGETIRLCNITEQQIGSRSCIVVYLHTGSSLQLLG
jgi:hypothetical protein